MSLLRRDPRAERIARNRLHPEHVSATPQPTLGPTGLARKNPRAAAFMGPNGLKRIDRSGVQGPASATRSIRQDTAQTVELELPLHQVTDPDYYVVAVLDMVGGRLTRHDKDILGQGHQLIQQGPERGAVVAVVFGEHKEHD
ncbi:MAG: electron transfer flavoprotein subunit alpha/FixB family protein, partial [Natronospirillum sp.]